MSENEKKLRTLYADLDVDSWAGIPNRRNAMGENEKKLRTLWYDVYHKASQDAPTENNAVAKAEEAVAAEAVRRWLRDLPTVDEGLREAYQHAYLSRKASVGIGWVMEWERVVDGIAAVRAVLKQRGWIDTSILPAGDEGLYETFTEGGPFIDRAKAGIAAVLAVNAQRLRDAVKGDPLWKTIHEADAPETPLQSCVMCERASDAVLTRLHAEGWFSPEEVSAMHRELEQASDNAEKLRTQVAQLAQAKNDWENRAVTAEAQVKRLRSERDSWRAATHTHERRIDEAEVELQEARCEVERLKAELTKANAALDATLTDLENRFTAAEKRLAETVQPQADGKTPGEVCRTEALAYLDVVNHPFSELSEERKAQWEHAAQLGGGAAVAELQRRLARVTAQRDRACKAVASSVWVLHAWLEQEDLAEFDRVTKGGE
jgi:hypothetical protein